MEKNLLYFMLGNVEMAKVSTKQLIEITPYEDFRSELLGDLSEYEKFYNKILEVRDADEKLKDVNPIAEFSTKMSIMFKTMHDKSRSKMSEMLIKGFEMGLSDIEENLAKAVQAREKPQMIELAKEYKLHLIKKLILNYRKKIKKNY